MPEQAPQSRATPAQHPRERNQDRQYRARHAAPGWPWSQAHPLFKLRVTIGVEHSVMFEPLKSSARVQGW